uniref:(northern house mosquito) hypothetical protein n=1 Tax=Culex pipiens TaxID=7175 RepID=A0A8D8AJH4_CULPI
MKPFALLTAAGLKKCHHRQLLLLLLSSSLAAKTQIYSQEVAFNCHFFLLPGCFPSTRRRGAVPWKDAAFFIILLLFWVRRNFAIFAGATSPRLLFFRVHNPSWLRAT